MNEVFAIKQPLKIFFGIMLRKQRFSESGVGFKIHIYLMSSVVCCFPHHKVLPSNVHTSFSFLFSRTKHRPILHCKWSSTICTIKLLQSQLSFTCGSYKVEVSSYKVVRYQSHLLECSLKDKAMVVEFRIFSLLDGMSERRRLETGQFCKRAWDK